MLEAIIQLPNNIFYNTGITTYIWIVTNRKPEHRRGRVQLINASEMYTKRRKNLGEKNCDLMDDHINTITSLYLGMADEGVSKVFDNSDFGYFKVTVERPLRKSAQFTPERVATIRFHPSIQEEMAWVWEKYGDEVYTGLTTHRDLIEDYLDREEITLTAKNRKALTDPKVWKEQRDLMGIANGLMAEIGQEQWDDFNAFTDAVNKVLKARKVKLTAPLKNQILNAVSWRNENARKIIKKTHKLSGEKLADLLVKLGTKEEHLDDFGYWASDTPGEFIEYETDSELRDTENIPLKEDIHEYFLREVRPHVCEAWLDIASTKIGYEISFNRYFYQHKPLRELEDVARDILTLERETEGLLKRLVSLSSMAV